MSLSLFPARVPIGTVDPSGNVLMTPEFSRALSDVLQRIGGSDGMGSGDIYKFAANLAVLEVFDAVPAAPATVVAVDQAGGGQVRRLRAEVAQLRAELAMLRPAANLAKRLEEIRILLEMQKAPTKPRKIIPGTATGSRSANAALASLLTALAASGLVIDSTTV